MAAPQWITNAGSLGTAVELKPYELELQVSTGNSRAEFQIVSGGLPPGLILTPSGNIKGYPSGKLSGVPLDVNEETVFTFVIRCINDLGELSDRTFSIIVTGEDPPEPRTAPYSNRNLGTFADGTWVEVDVTALDRDPGDTLTYRVVGGRLPLGLELSSTGRITGYAEPVTEPSVTYNFDINITDGKIPVIATYNIIIVQSDLLTSDTVEIYTDSSLSDSSISFRAPVLLDRGTAIDTVLDENYFYYRFSARDFDGDDIGFEILPIVRRPTVVSSVVDPVLTQDDEISIDGKSVVLTGTTVVDLAADINRAIVPGVSAEVNNGRLLIYTENPSIVLVEVSGTLLQTLGFLTPPTIEYTASRNPDDTDGDLITQDLDEVLPEDLAINTDTGWLYGYLKPISQGEKVYNFWVRVYKKKHEASEIAIQTDYATTLPFSIVNNQTQAVLDNLGLDVPYTNFVDKTIVFFQQENMSATYDGLDGTTYTTDPSTVEADGWFDETSTIIPGWTESSSSTSSSIQNKRAGLWKFVESVTPGYYVLEFVQEIQQGSIVYAKRFTGTNADSYSEPSVKRLYQTGSNWDPTAVVQSNSVTDTMILDSVAEIVVGATVTGNNITGGTTVLSINNTLSTVTLSAAPTGSGVYAGDTLTFSSNQTVPTFTEYHLVNPSSTLWEKQITISSSANYLLNWVTDTDLGDIMSGVPCKFRVEAVNQGGSKVKYRFVSKNFKTVLGNFTQSEYIRLDSVDNLALNMTVSGEGIVGYPLVLEINESNSTVRLSSAQTISNNTTLGFDGTDIPRGLRISENGEIEGRISHQHFVLNDRTTFDVSTGETTFDRTYTVNVVAETYLNDPIQRLISSTKTFTFRVLDYKTRPSSNFYLEFALNERDRNEISRAIYNDLIIPDENVYRPDDHWFGRQNRYRMLVGYGLDTAKDAEVISAIAAYHYNKRYVFRELRWAQSLDSNGNVEYEVIYVDPLDNLTTSTGNTITGTVDVRSLNIPITTDTALDSTDTELLDVSQDRLLDLYPASLPNMQRRFRTVLTPNNRKFLPSWMTSRQPNNRYLNYVQAVPLVYLKPGTGKLALYKLQQVLKVNTVSAVTDRYAWDDGLALNYDKDLDQFKDNQPTTWDQIIIDDNVPIRIVGEVDFAVDSPFCQINGKLMRDLQIAGVVDGARGSLHNKTLVFYKQENFAASEIEEFPDYDGWGRLNPSFDETELVTLIASTTSNTVITVDSVDRIREGMTAQGTGIIRAPVVTAVDTVLNTVTLSVVQTLDVGTQVSFVDLYGDNYETYRIIPGYTELTKTQTVTAVVTGNTVASQTVILDSVYLITVGQTVSGGTIAGSPTVTSIDAVTRAVTLNSVQTLNDGDTLTFTTPGAYTVWSSGSSYTQGDIVSYNGAYYVCVYAHSAEPSFPADYFVLLDTPQDQYQRAGIWRMLENESGIITLRFEQSLGYTGETFDSVIVRSGVRHGGQVVSLVDPATLGIGYSVPGFINRDSQMNAADGTVFDNRTTEFFDQNTDTYLETDQGTKYIKFIHSTIIDRGIVDV